jgi:hypothetical protein
MEQKEKREREKQTKNDVSRPNNFAIPLSEASFHAATGSFPFSFSSVLALPTFRETCYNQYYHGWEFDNGVLLERARDHYRLLKIGGVLGLGRVKTVGGLMQTGAICQKR